MPPTLSEVLLSFEPWVQGSNDWSQLGVLFSGSQCVTFFSYSKESP